jgi:hypothetical protein
MKPFDFGARGEYQSFVASQLYDFLLVEKDKTLARLCDVWYFALFLIVNERMDGGRVQNVRALLVEELGRGM